MTNGLLVLLLSLGVNTGGDRPQYLAPPRPDLPVLVSDANYKPLVETLDPRLQRRLEDGLRQNPRWADLVREQKMAVGVVDLREVANPRFAHLNGDTMMYAASLPKIAVLLGAVQALEDERLTETPELIQDLHDMIRVSSNTAATRVIDQIGYDGINSVLMSRKNRLFDPDRNGGLWVGKRFAEAGDRRGDPLHNISHGATVTQVCRFYYMLATGRLVSPERSRQMLSMLADPGLNHKFVHSLARIAPEARLYRKSGTWQVWHSDSVLVWGQFWRHYILVALVEDADGERILQGLVPVVEEALNPQLTASIATPVSTIDR